MIATFGVIFLPTEEVADDESDKVGRGLMGGLLLAASFNNSLNSLATASSFLLTAIYKQVNKIMIPFETNVNIHNYV